MPDLLSDDRCPPGWCRSEEIVRLHAALAAAAESITNLRAALAVIKDSESIKLAEAIAALYKTRTELMAAQAAFAEYKSIYQYNDADIDVLNDKIAEAQRMLRLRDDLLKEVGPEVLHHRYAWFAERRAAVAGEKP